MELMRGHNEGSLFRRRTGQWVAVVTMRDGRRASRWAKTRDEAKAELAELLRLRDAGAPLTGRVRLGEFLERWVASDHDLAPATLRKHRSIIRVHLIPELGHVRLSELSPEDVSGALRVYLRSELGPQSVRHVRATLRRCLADAVRDGLVTRNAAGLARAPKLLQRERTILDAAQARILIESTRGTRYGPLWTILVTTGLRISEALGLAWSSVDFGGNDGQARTTDDVLRHGATRHRGSDVQVGPRRRTDDERAASSGFGGGMARAGSDGLGISPPTTARPSRDVRGPSITVRHQLARENGEWVRRPPKTAKGRRTIPLTPLGVEALQAQRRQQDADRGVRGIDGLVFTSPTGHPLHETNTLKALYADLAAADLPRVTQHDLRHSCATLLYGMGVPLPTISDILGHSTVRVTQDLYRHRVDELSVAAAERMQEALG